MSFVDEGVECGKEDTEECNGDEEAPASSEAVSANEDVVDSGSRWRSLICDDGIGVWSVCCGEVGQVGLLVIGVYTSVSDLRFIEKAD
jgi:hypothetical protein